MPVIDLIEYEPNHINEIMKNPREWELKISHHPDWGGWKEFRKTQGPAYTLLVDGQPIGSGGVIIMDNNIGEAWMVWSNVMKIYQKSIYRTIKRILDVIISEFRLFGVQAFVDPQFDLAKHFMKHLGFIEDGPIRVCDIDMIRFWRAC